MEISQISDIQSLVEKVTSRVAPEKEAEVSFTNIFSNAIANVKQTEATVKNDAVMAAAGLTDDLHTVIINAEKAELALSMLVQVRNKALDAYNEIMRMAL